MTYLEVPVPPTAVELHSGVVSGRHIPTGSIPPGPSDDAAPRRALESVILAHLRSGPCVVQFSGGRDSSLVLALAVHVARRESLPVPRAVTMRYRGVAGAAEDEWQDLVTGHLGIPLEIVEVPAGSDEIAGPLGLDRLLRDGPVIPPPSLVSLGRLGPVTQGCTVLTGEGGDEVLGASRISSWTWHWRRRRRPTARNIRLMTATALPHVVRERRVRRTFTDPPLVPWLRPDPMREVLTGLLDDASRTPWDWRTSRWEFLDKRLCAVGFGTMRAVAEREGFTIVHPLIERGFVAALCRRGGRAGLATRTEAMHLLAGDLLPPQVLGRLTKAVFNGVYAGRRVREFAAQWDGSGVDPELVDVDALRAAWRSDVVLATSLAPLQLALCAASAQGWAPSEDAA